MTRIGAKLLVGAALIRQVDAYLDAAPRPDAEPVETGPFTLFVGRAPTAYYARPALSCDRPISRIDVQNLEKACTEKGVSLEIEWVHEIHPELAEIAADYGLTVTTFALMVAGADGAAAPEIADATLRVIGADDAALRSGRAVAHLSFTLGGTSIGVDGVPERAAAMSSLSEDLVGRLRDRARAGLTVTAVAESDMGVLAVGSYQPIGDVAEIVAVATLPAARRQGLAGAVTALLTQDARGHGVRTVFLSAQNDDVARIYRRVGFGSVGHTHAAQRQ